MCHPQTIPNQVEVQIIKGLSQSDYRDETLVLAWGAAAANISPTDQFDGTLATQSQNTIEYGGPADMWGTALTPAIVNSSDFGLVYRAVRNNTGSGNRSLALISARIRITFSDAGIDGTVRNTQMDVSVLTSDLKAARVTQQYAEVLSSSAGPVRVTQQYVEVLTQANVIAPIGVAKIIMIGT